MIFLKENLSAVFTDGNCNMMYSLITRRQLNNYVLSTATAMVLLGQYVSKDCPSGS